MCLTVTKTGERFRQENPHLKTITVYKILSTSYTDWAVDALRDDSRGVIESKSKNTQLYTLYQRCSASPGCTIHAAFPLPSNHSLQCQTKLGPEVVHAYHSKELLGPYISSSRAVVVECEVPVEHIVAFGNLTDVALTELTLPNPLKIVTE